MTESTYLDAVRRRDPRAVRRRGAGPLLAGLARWGEATGHVVSLGLPDEGHDGGPDTRGALVAVVGPQLAVVAATDGGASGDLVWTADLDAVRDVLTDLAGASPSPAASQALGSLPSSAPGAPGAPRVAAVLDALAAGIAADRRRIAAELHDGPVQHLTAAQLLLDSAMWSGQDIPATAREPIEQGLAALLQGIGGCRDVMRRLADPDGGHDTG